MVNRKQSIKMITCPQCTDIKCDIISSLGLHANVIHFELVMRVYLFEIVIELEIIYQIFLVFLRPEFINLGDPLLV